MAEQELKVVVDVIRAILTSAPSEGLLTRQLLNDYKNIEGSPLPFKKFGYDSVDDLIQKSGEFIQRRTSDGIKIVPRESEGSAHIQRMVQQQKTTSKKKKPTNQRPIHSPTANNQRWQGSAYTNMYSRLPNRSVKKAVAAPTNIPSLMSMKIEPPPMRSNRQYGQPSAQPQYANGNNSNNQQMVQPSTTSVPFARRNGNQDMRPITKQSNIVDNDKKFNYNSNKIEPPPSSTNQSLLPNGQAGNRILSRINANQNNSSTYSTAPQVTVPRAVPSGPVSPNGSVNITRPKLNLSDRLASKKPLTEQMAGVHLDTDVVDFVNAPPASNSPEIITRCHQETKVIQFDELEQMIATEALAKFCEYKRYASPTYKCFRTPKTHKFQCRVAVNNVIYSTYPSEFETELDARLEAADLAFKQMKEAELSVKYEVCTDNFRELALKIRECIPSSHGVFQKKIPELFQEMHKLTLPENWCGVITDFPQLFSSDEGIGDKIVYKITDSEPDDSNVSMPAITRTIQQPNEPEKPDELILPWHDQHWNVFITNPVSTVEVWARLIGTEYSGKMDTLLTDIELALFSNKKVAETIYIGHIYLVMISECWYRVRIERKNMEQRRVWCFFIDVGDEDWYSIDEIYMCDPAFVRFPAQAICFTLFGLEDFAENPNARRQVDDHLAGKSLIAQVLTRKDEYIANENSNDLEAKIQTILYDTTTYEDVQLNLLISRRICETTEAPQLQRVNCNFVNISYIADTGDIYCHLVQSKSSLQYINKLIHQLTDGTFDYTKYQYVVNESASSVMSRLYLIYDKCDHKWYRAAILPSNSIGSTEQCNCIDYGWTKTIEREHIYMLDLLSSALNSYPAQAILVRLHEITTYNDNVIQRLRGLLNPTSTVMVQVVSGSPIPIVNIYKRLETTKVLCKINDTIRMEQELENSSDLMFDANDSFNSSTELAASVRSIKITKRNQFFELPQFEVPSQDEYFNCVVTMASNPSNFTVQPHSLETEFKKMMENLQKYCKGNNQTVSEGAIREGECFAGLNKEDTIWYRVIIQRVFTGGMVVAHNCDYGDIAMLTTSDLRQLPEQFLKLPQLAIKANLHGVRPKNKDWSTDDCTRFQELTVGKRFASQIKAINRDQIKYELELVLIDVSTEQDILINEVLIDEGRAN